MFQYFDQNVIHELLEKSSLLQNWHLLLVSFYNRILNARQLFLVPVLYRFELYQPWLCPEQNQNCFLKVGFLRSRPCFFFKKIKISDEWRFKVNLSIGFDLSRLCFQTIFPFLVLLSGLLSFIFVVTFF